MTRIVSLINELLFGGDENRLLSYSRTSRLDQRVLCIKAPNADFDAANGTMRGLYAAAGVHVEDLGEGYPNLHAPRALKPLHRAAMLARTVRRFRHYLRREQIHVVDAHLGAGSLVAAIACALEKIPYAVTTYHVEEWEPLWLWRRVHPWVLRNAAAVITDSQPCADALQAFMGKAGAEVIPNGIEPPKPSLPRADVKRLLGIPEGARVVGQIATLIPTKGQRTVLDAAAEVLREEPGVFFLLVGFERGGPEYARDLRAKAASLGIAERVRITGYPGDIGDVWSVLDVHVHPTELDSLPQAILEAMSLGLPSITTPVGGIATLQAGVMVPPHNPGALAEAVLRVLREPLLAAQLGRSARERYRERYTTRIMTDALDGVFQRISGRAGERTDSLFAQRRAS